MFARNREVQSRSPGEELWPPAPQRDSSPLGHKEIGGNDHNLSGDTGSDARGDLDEEFDGCSDDEIDVVMSFAKGLTGIAEKLIDGPFDIEMYVRNCWAFAERDEPKSAD